MREKSIFIFLCIINAVGLFAQYDVRSFGAKGDGVANDTRAIQTAIDSAAKNKGGVINFSAGEYKVGTLVLRSNIEIHLMPGAVVRGSNNITDYAAVDQQYESRTKNLYAKYFMFFAEGEHGISFTGTGTIDGNGLKYFQEVRPQNGRPYMIRLVKCSNILFRDVNLVESANWTLHLLACSNVSIDAVTVVTTAEGNRDGLDIDACSNVRIANSYISTTDDAIVMKATSDDLCTDITIANCILSSRGSAVKTGTESNGGFKNIAVSNCVIKNIPYHAGIELMTVDGGVMENILVENVTMENVATPFFIHIGLRARPFKSHQYVNSIGNVSNISLHGINVVNAQLPASIVGLPNKKLLKIALSNYTAKYSSSQKAAGYNKIPLLEFDYPAANMFTNLPAFGIYCRDVEGLDLQNIRLYASDSAENRAALVFDRVDNLNLFSSEASVNTLSAPFAYFRNTNNAIISLCRTSNANRSLLQIEGSRPQIFRLINNLLRAGQQEVIYAAKLPQEKYPDTVKPQSLKSGIIIPLVMDDGAQQLSLMLKNKLKEPGKVLIRYNNTQQEFVVDWNEWGWAPISLVNQFSKGEKLDVTIEGGGELMYGGYLLRSTDYGYTD